MERHGAVKEKVDAGQLHQSALHFLSPVFLIPGGRVKSALAALGVWFLSGSSTGATGTCYRLVFVYRVTFGADHSEDNKKEL